MDTVRIVSTGTIVLVKRTALDSVPFLKERLKMKNNVVDLSGIVPGNILGSFVEYLCLGKALLHFEDFSFADFKILTVPMSLHCFYFKERISAHKSICKCIRL